MKKADVFNDARLGIQPEYFECPICMSMIPEIIECPRCSARSCKDCLVGFTNQNKNFSANDLQNLFVPCTQCHEKVHMK